METAEEALELAEEWCHEDITHGERERLWDATASMREELRGRARRDGLSPRAFCRQLSACQTLAGDLYRSLHDFHSIGESKYGPIWTHQQFRLIRAGDKSRGFAIDRQSLLDVASRYVSKPELQSASMDWLLLDALVFAELDAFADEVNSGHVLGTINWAAIFADHSEVKLWMYSMLFGILKVAFIFVLLPGTAIYLAVKGHEFTRSS